jgi:small-conductance mechanosensitive channel
MNNSGMEWITAHSIQIGSVAAILAAGLVLYFSVRRALKLLVKNQKLAAPVVTLLLMLLRWMIIMLLALIIMAQAGVLQNVWAAILAVLAAVAIGFVAGWSILSNAFCTLLILIYKPYKIGEDVEIPSDGISGKAVDLNLMHTILKDKNGALVHIPNNTFFTKPVIRVPGEHQITLFEQFNADVPFDT